MPLLVRATPLSDTQIAVWWSPPLQSGGAAVTGYSVQWDVTASFGPTSYSVQVNWGTERRRIEIVPQKKERKISLTTHIIR